MTTRRRFITGLLATGAVPAVTWADAGNPSFLAAAKLPNGRFSLFGLNDYGEDIFEIPLPSRGHAAAAHPTRPEAIAFARRPGRFALVIDCANGTLIRQLDAPTGRHFYGHGTFIDSGNILCTTENEIETGHGIIGLWSRSENYRRIGEVASGGIGPHEIKTLSNDQTIVVANGGIRTHPDTGRTKLNLDEMRPNVSFVNIGTQSYHTAVLDQALHQNSIRHLDVGQNDRVVFGTQWQGDPFETVPLVGSVIQGQDIDLLHLPQNQSEPLKNYVASIAVIPQTGSICVTAPRGGIAHIYHDNVLIQTITRADVSGVAANGLGFAISDGNGSIIQSYQSKIGLLRKAPRQWDNHLVSVF